MKWQKQNHVITSTAVTAWLPDAVTISLVKLKPFLILTLCNALHYRKVKDLSVISCYMSLQ